MGETSKLPDPSEQTFVSHLVELRSRLLRAVVFVLVLFLAMAPFANALYTTLAQPLLASLPQGSSMIATQVAAPFFTPFKFAFMFSLFVSIPFLLYQAWAFVAPGLYASERRVAFPVLVSSIVLFYCGLAFAYFVVFPWVLGYFMGSAPDGVTVMTDITSYLDFVMGMFFAFGMAFEVPVATFIMVMIGVTTVDALAAKRKHIIVGAFVIGAIFTPPDVLSQFLLAIPIWLLFEAGLLAARMVLKDKSDLADTSPP